jgi:putative salt-induced outer membrane protein YdiY
MSDAIPSIRSRAIAFMEPSKTPRQMYYSSEISVYSKLSSLEPAGTRMRPTKYLFVLPILAAAAMLLSAPAFAREKLDVIVFVNGDRITGEIIELQHGQLTVKTHSLGTVKIDWLDVARIESPYNFFVESNAGSRYSGGIVAAPEAGHILITGKSEAVNLSVTDVAILTQLDSDFIERLSGSISLGFNQTKSSGVRSLSFGFDTEYQSEKILADLEGNFNSTHTTDSGTLDQYSLNFANQFLRPGDHFWLGLASYESNEQQGIDGRLLVGAARGKYWIRKADAELATFAGVGLAQEWATGAVNDQQSVEGLLGLQWKVFRFNDPKTSITARLLILPSLTESGRYRSNTSISLDHEIVKDFYVDLSFNGSYDSDPPDATADTVDYSISTSLTYKY